MVREEGLECRPIKSMTPQKCRPREDLMGAIDSWHGYMDADGQGSRHFHHEVHRPTMSR